MVVGYIYAHAVARTACIVGKIPVVINIKGVWIISRVRQNSRYKPQNSDFAGYTTFR